MRLLFFNWNVSQWPCFHDDELHKVGFDIMYMDHIVRRFSQNAGNTFDDTPDLHVFGSLGMLNGIDVHDSMDWMCDGVVNTFEVRHELVNIVKIIILQKFNLFLVSLD